jgi:hypothetical protein
MYANWHEMWEFASDRHRALLAEVARGRQGQRMRGRATMRGHERDEATIATSAAGTCQHQANEPGADGEAWRQGAGFTREEFRRLVFLRWLYDRGRLSEWC